MKNAPVPTGIRAIWAPVNELKTVTTSGGVVVVDDSPISFRSSTSLTQTSPPSGVTATLVGFDPGDPDAGLGVGVSVATTLSVVVSITLTEPGAMTPLLVT